MKKYEKELKKLVDESSVEGKESELFKWFITRPIKIRKAILSHPPHLKYRMKAIDQIGVIYCYSEDNKNKSGVSVTFDTIDLLGMPLRVFGVGLDDIEKIK